MLLVVFISKLEQGCSKVTKVADATLLFRVMKMRAHKEELHTDLCDLVIRQ